MFFLRPRRNWSVFSMAKWNLSAGTEFALFRLSAQNQFRIAFSSPQQSRGNLTDILICVKLCLSHDFNNGSHIFFGLCLVYHLRFGMESQVEWALLLSLKRLLTVLWHMDNPTRNQSLHSYWGNRWANMFPGGCPYYSGATGPPGDSGARWNWGAVTTEWTGNELLQDKWAATWETRNPLTKSRGRECMAASALLPQLRSCMLYIYMYAVFFLNRRGISEWLVVWWLEGWLNKVRVHWGGDKDTKQVCSNLFLKTQPHPTKGILIKLF